MYSENKGAGKLICACFRLCRLLVFPCGGSYYVYGHPHSKHNLCSNNVTRTDCQLIHPYNKMVANSEDPDQLGLGLLFICTI